MRASDERSGAYSMLIGAAANQCFKTGQAVPVSLEAIPPPHLRQMAVYRAALQKIFPDRPVEAALLYTSGPRLFVLDPALLDIHLPAPAD